MSLHFVEHIFTTIHFCYAALEFEWAAIYEYSICGDDIDDRHLRIMTVVAVQIMTRQCKYRMWQVFPILLIIIFCFCCIFWEHCSFYFCSHFNDIYVTIFQKMPFFSMHFASLCLLCMHSPIIFQCTLHTNWYIMICWPSMNLLLQMI